VLGEILVDIRTSDRITPRPAVLVLHGFKGFKDWGMFPSLAERIARAGFTAVSFNVSGSGVDQQGEFTLPERFGRNTYSAELEDVSRVMEALADGALGMAPLSASACGSPAAAIALLTAAGTAGSGRWRPGRDRGTHLRRIRWRSGAPGPVDGQQPHAVLPLCRSAGRLEKNGEALRLTRAAARIAVPWLLLHGDADPAVPVAEAHELASAALKPPRVMVFPDSGHTFGAVHPYAGLTEELAQAMDETVKWLGRYL
jgi:dienelactone hydrolase